MTETARLADSLVARKPLARRLIEVVAVAIAYYAAARLGLLMQLPGTNVSAVWPPSGIALAAMLLWGTSLWPGVFAGAFFANLLTLPPGGAVATAATAIAVGNTVAPLLAVALIRQCCRGRQLFTNAASAFCLVGAALVSALVAASSGVTALWELGLLPAETYRQAWLTWWVGDVTGMVILVPALMAWVTPSHPTASTGRLPELAAVCAVTLVATGLLFGGWSELALIPARLAFFFLPVVLWTAFRFGLREVASLVAVVASLAILDTWTTMDLVTSGQVVASHALGAFVDPHTSPTQWLLGLQLFLCTMAIIGLVLNSAVVDRNLSANALIASEHRFRTIFEEAAAGVALIESATGQVRRVNQRYCDIVGRPLEDLPGRSLNEITHPDDLQRTSEYLGRLSGGGPQHAGLEKRYIRPDGSIVWVNLRVSPTCKVGEHPEEHIVVAEDITERKHFETRLRQVNQTLEARVRERTTELEALNKELHEVMRLRALANESLAESEQRLKLALENARHGLWDWDVQSGGVVVDTNFWVVYGYEPHEPPPTFDWWSSSIHTDDRARVLAALESSLRSDEVLYDVDYRARRKDGEWIWVNTRGRVQARDADGRPLRMMGTLHDITERKHAQQAFEEQERRYRLIVDAASDIIYRTDADGHCTFTNAAAERVLHTPVDQLIGRHYLTLIRPDAREAARAFYERQVRLGVPTTYYEFPAMTSLNTEVWFGQNVQMLIEDGQLVGFQGVARDISDRKRMERELQDARDRAVDSARLKSEFLANMSHEIRTPMNGVIGLAELIAETPLTDEQRHYVDGIRASGESLLTIINDILDFSKIEAGMLTVDRIEFDLRTSVAHTLRLLEEAARRKHLDLNLAFLEGVPSAVYGDPVRLRQVLTNLVGNAVKFTAAGHVTVRVSVETTRGSDKVVRWEVSDTGIGIAPHALGQLFSPFVQADGSVTRRFGGTGLGLAISKRLVELMGGAIGAESTEGFGSTFWFTVPLETREPAPTPERGPVRLDGRRALVVEPSNASRLMLTQALASLGLDTTELKDAVHAIDVLRTAAREGRPFDVAILNPSPEVSASELARAIKGTAALQSVRLVLTPSAGRRGDGRNARESGVDAFLPQPVAQAELAACLSHLLADRRAPDRTASAGTLMTRHSLAEQGAADTRPLILVADDNALNRDVTRGQLEKLGYRVTTADNGEEAVRAVADTRYDAVLMDCQMPGMDGFSATAEIRRREGHGPRTPIVALTASALPGERERCLHAGMDAYITKPVTRADLAKVVERWRRRPGDERASAAVRAAPRDSAAADSIDEAALEAVREEVGSERLGTFVDMLLSDVTRLIDGLNAGPADTERATIAREAHRLNGSSRTLGFSVLGHACAEIERLAADESASPAWLACAEQLHAAQKHVVAWQKQQNAPTVR